MGALACLEKCESRDLWQHETEQIAERAQVDLDAAREARRAVSRPNEGRDIVSARFGDIISAGVKWLVTAGRATARSHGGHQEGVTRAVQGADQRQALQLVLTTQARQILLQDDTVVCQLAEILPPLESSSTVVQELTSELKQAAREAYPHAAVLSDTRALLALEASRYVGESTGWPTVEAALSCLIIGEKAKRLEDKIGEQTSHAQAMMGAMQQDGGPGARGTEVEWGSAYH